MTPLRQKLFQLLVTALALAAIGQIGAFFVGFGSLTEDLGATAWLVIGALSITNVTAIAACVLALAMVWRVADRADARALALFLVFLGLFWGSVFRFMSFEYDATDRMLNFGLTMGRGLVQLSYAALMLSIASFLRFSVLFPQPLTRSAVAAGGGMRLTKVVRTWFVSPLLVWGIPLVLIALLVLPNLGKPALPPGPGGLVDIFALWGLRGLVIIVYVTLIYVVLPAVLITLGTINLRHGHRSSRGEERRRSNWVVTGFVTAAWMVLIPVALFFIPLPDSLSFLVATLGLLFLAPTVLLIFLTVGIFNAGAIDPELILKRSTVLGIFSGLLIVGFAMAESIVSELIESRMEGMGDMVGAVLAGALVALVLIPFRGKIKHASERWATHTATVTTPTDAG